MSVSSGDLCCLGKFGLRQRARSDDEEDTGGISPGCCRPMNVRLQDAHDTAYAVVFKAAIIKYTLGHNHQMMIL